MFDTIPASSDPTAATAPMALPSPTLAAATPPPATLAATLAAILAATLPIRVLRGAGREAVEAGKGLAGTLRTARTRIAAAGLSRLAVLAATRPDRLLGPVGLARRLWPQGRFLAEAEALMVARSRGWRAAAPHFARLSDPGNPRAGTPALALLAPPAPGPGVRLALPATGRPATLTAAEAAEIVVYTAAFGRAPGPAPVFEPGAPLRFFCFTDRLPADGLPADGLPADGSPADGSPADGPPADGPLVQPGTAIPGWTLLPAAAGSPDPATDPAGAAAFHKIRPETALAGLPGVRASLWLDPDRLLVGNPETFIARWLLPADIALWRNLDGDWRAMAERHLLCGPPSAAGPAAGPAAGSAAGPAAVLLAQAEAFAAARVPGGRGACDTGMVWRRHDTPAAARFAAAWWRAWEAAPGADDLALYRALAENPGDNPAGIGGGLAGDLAGDHLAADLAGSPGVPRPAILPSALGPATDNLFTARSVPGPRRRPSAGRSGASRPLPLVFLSAAAHAKSASTLLRGHQLSAMVAAAFPDRYAVRFTEDAGDVRDAVVVLTKGAMATLPPETIAAVAGRNRAAIGAWDDIRPDPEKARIVDAHMTLSYRQTIDFNRMFPATPAFLVTHHVNSRMPAVTSPADRLRTGYFGDLENTVRPAALAGMVDLVGIDTRDVNAGGDPDSWLAALPAYNCHWIVRRARPWDGWKPFLKGFVAARCGATVITTADDGDAACYLGDDYPFYARSLAEPDLEIALAEAAAAFGGPAWRQAREIMDGVAARSTDARVLAEFDAMVRSVAE